MGKIIALLLSLSLLNVAAGAELHGQKFDDKIVVNKLPLFLNGLGLRQMTIFKVSVYVAALYLEHPSSDEAAILGSSEAKQVDIVFLRDVEAKDIVHSWDEGYERNCEAGCDALKPQLGYLDSLMTDVKRGQKVSFLFRGDGFELSTPGKAPVAFHGKPFSELILATFIGKHPPSEDLKLGMLGKLNPRSRELASPPTWP